MLLPVENPKQIDNSESDLDHIYCNCTPNLGLCGTNLIHEPDNEEWEDYSDNTCLVCKYLDEENFPCKFCGFTY